MMYLRLDALAFKPSKSQRKLVNRYAGGFEDGCFMADLTNPDQVESLRHPWRF